MKQSKRTWVVAGALFLIVVSSKLALYHLKGGFAEDNIQSFYQEKPQHAVRAPTGEEDALAQKILNQSFTYLGKGCQSYVFLSDDGQHVLKFFKYHRVQPPYWLSYLTFIPFAEKKWKEKVEIKEEKLDLILTGCKVSFEKLQDTTGIVYFHKNKTSTPQKNVTVFDKLGCEHRIPLEGLDFLLQKRMYSMPLVLDEALQQHDTARAHAILSSLVGLIISECSRGMIDKDRAILQNMGVIDGQQAIRMDVGQMTYRPNASTKEGCHAEILRQTEDFREWLEQRSVTLAEEFDKIVESQLQAFPWQATSAL